MDHSLKLSEALAAAQGQFTNPPKDRENPHFKSRYATLDSMQNATRKALSENGLSVTQGGIKTADGGWELQTTLRHAGGGEITSYLPLLAAARGPQAFGSEITYMRRYAYAAILNIAADEDDDANTAQHAPAAQHAPTGRHYEIKPHTEAPVEGDVESGKAIGIVGPIKATADGKCWFVNIGALGTVKGESVWTRDKDLADSLNQYQGTEVHAHLRSKKPGSYQIVSFIPTEPELGV